MTIRIPKLVASLGALVLAVLVIALVAPRSARAVAAALVQITNPVASPGNTQDTSRQAAQIVTLSCNLTGTGNPYRCGFDYVTPANQSLVITDADIQEGSSGQYNFFLQAGPNSSNLTTVANWFGQTILTDHYSYTTGVVIPPNSEVYLTPNGGNTTVVYAYFHGYLTYQ